MPLFPWACAMGDVKTMLPQNAGALEKAMAAGMSDDLPIPFAALMNPYTTRADLLPWLGFQASLDLWFDDWPEARKREAVAQAAGVSTLYEGELAALKTTRGGAVRYLALVDADLVDAISYPALAVCGEAVCGSAVIDHPAHLATYLVKVEVADPRAAYVGSAFASAAVAGEIDSEPYDRCLVALRAAKAAHTEILVDFQNARVLTAGDAVTAGAGYLAGQYLERVKL